MTSVKRIGSADTTPASQVTPSSTSSGATPAALADRPQRRLTAVMPAELRAIDWCGHMPTAPHGPVTMTRAEVQEQLAATAYDEHVLGFGAIHAHRAFGSAA